MNLVARGKKEVVFTDRPPAEILTGVDRQAKLLEGVGAASEITDAMGVTPSHEPYSQGPAESDCRSGQPVDIFQQFGAMVALSILLCVFPHPCS